MSSQIVLQPNSQHPACQSEPDLGKEEGDDNEPNDIIGEGTEGLAEGQSLGEDCCSD